MARLRQAPGRPPGRRRLRYSAHRRPVETRPWRHRRQPRRANRTTPSRAQGATLPPPGDKEKGNNNTPLEPAIRNEIDRFRLAIDVINRVERLQVAGAHVKERPRDLQIDCRHAYACGIDKPEVADWTGHY